MLGVKENFDWSLQKRDANGTLIWVTRTTARNTDTFFYTLADVVASPDGGFVAFGTTGARRQRNSTNSVFVEKFDRNGVSVWSRQISYNPSTFDTYVNQALVTPEGGYLLVGGTLFFPNRDGRAAWAAKLDGQGNIIWQKQYQERALLDDAILNPYFNGSFIASGVNNLSSDVTNTLNIGPDGDPGGGYYQPGRVAGTSSALVAVPARNGNPTYHTFLDNTSQNAGDFRLTNAAQNDQPVWTKTLGGSGNDVPQDIITTDDGGYIVVGTTTSTDGDVQGKSGGSRATWIVKLTNAPPANALALTQPTYNCSTGAITFNTTGGDGSTITYSAPGISRSSATSNTGVVEQGLRNDPKPIKIMATQSGQTVSYFFNIDCSIFQYPVLISPIPDLTLTVGEGVSQTVDQYFNRDPRGGFKFAANGLPPGLYSIEEAAIRAFRIAGAPTTTGVYTVTITVTNTEIPTATNSVSTTFKITVGDKPVVNPPTPPIGGTLALTQPTYNCQTGAITFNTTGGDGSPITYSAPGISRSSATSNTGTVESGLRNDPKPITITAVQNGQTASFTFDLAAFCSNNPTRKPSPVFASIPDRTFTVGQFADGAADLRGFVIGSGLYLSNDPFNYLTWSFTATGLPPGLRIGRGVLSGTAFYVAISGRPTEAGTYPVTVTSIDPLFPNSPFVSRFTITIVDSATPPVGDITLLAPTYDCATGAFTFRTSGGNSLPIEYMAIGITDWTTNPNQFVDKDSRTANDVKPFTLMARQSGQTVTYVWDLKAACGRSQARVGTGERVAELSVSVLGNPVSEAATVEVRGAEGKPLSFRLIDLRGRLVESRSVGQAGVAERQRFDLNGQGPGLLLLRVSSGSQIKTVKIMKQ